MLITLDDLRRFAVARSLFPPTTLGRALDRMGFVQADPIRAPARAQDLTLRHRVQGYQAGDLERRYARLGLEEDFFVNYGFVTRPLQALMHPRSEINVPAGAPMPWPAARRKKAQNLLDFVRERGAVHPREVHEHFAHGRVKNYWGGSSNATTHLLDAMHYRGLLRVKRRDNGTRIYEAVEHAATDDSPAGRAARATALLELVLREYAPLPAPSFVYLTRLLLGYGAPHLAKETRAALVSARDRLACATIDGVAWYWPADENPCSTRYRPDGQVRLLAPFDPIVWDRRRFELLWGWTYRFEAYTPAPKRKLGYYALPLLWGDRVVGWGNASVREGRPSLKLGYANGTVREPDFRSQLTAERARLIEFLGL